MRQYRCENTHSWLQSRQLAYILLDSRDHISQLYHVCLLRKELILEISKYIDSKFQVVQCVVLQIVFGVCGDYLGRKKIYLLTLFIIIVATVGQAMAASTVFGTPVSAAIAS